MRVKLSQVKSNPFRELPNYPINRQKVEALKRSIHVTTFWENLIARRNTDKYEIAYGHHRLIALKEMFGDNYEFDLRIRDLTNAQMIQIMAQENMEDWALNPVVAMETVKTAKKFLEQNESGFKTRLYRDEAGKEIIAEFLSWPEERVKQALSHLRATGQIPGRGEKEIRKDQVLLTKEQIEDLPTQTHAAELIKQIKSLKPSEETKRKIIEKLKNGKIGTKDLRKEILKEELRREEFKKTKEQQRFEAFLDQCRKLKNKIDVLIEYKDYYRKTFLEFDFIDSAANLSKKIDILIKGRQDRYAKIRRSS